MSDATLGTLLLAEAASLEDLARVTEPGPVREVVVGGVVVAVIEPDAVEVRLRPAVAAAALRTPDATASPRGRGWVRLAPAVVDDFARDRALAWFDSAVGLALEDEAPA